MAIATRNYGNISITSSYTAYTFNNYGSIEYGISSYPSYVSSSNRDCTFSDLDIPAGSSINSASITFTSGDPQHGDGGKKLTISGTLYTTVTSGMAVDYDEGFFKLEFKSGTNNTSYPATPGIGVTVYKTNSSAYLFGNVTLTVNYTPPYSNCILPTTINMGTTVSYASDVTSYTTSGSSFYLRWNDGTRGTGVTAHKYYVYKNVGSAIDVGTASNYAITTPANGSSDYYKIKMISTAPTGYDSALSSAVYVYSYGAPSAPSTVNFYIGTTTVTDSAYVGGTNTPTINLQWSGAVAGTYGAITGYKIYQDGSQFKTVTTSATSGTTTVSAHATPGSNYVYTIKTIGSGTLESSISTARTIYTLLAPSAPGSFSVEPTASIQFTNPTYTWTEPEFSNATFAYDIDYTEDDESEDLETNWTDLTVQAATTYAFPISSITKGYFFKIRVYTIATATNGGTITSESALISTNACWRAALPASPVWTDGYIKDGSYPTSTAYTEAETDLQWKYTTPTNGATIKNYIVSYSLNGSTYIDVNTNTTSSTGNITYTHNHSAVARGQNIYYKITVTDIFDQTATLFSTAGAPNTNAYITKLNLPTIASTTAIVETGEPTMHVDISFTPGDGGHTRESGLTYVIYAVYSGEEQIIKPATTCTAGTPVSLTDVDIDITTLYNGGTGLTNLFGLVITDAKPTINGLGIRVNLYDNNWVTNLQTSSTTINVDYHTTPTIGALTNLIGNLTKPALAYVNSGNTLRITMPTTEWNNAYGNATGALLSYRIEGTGGPITFTSTASPQDIVMPTFTTDQTLSYTMTITQTYGDSTVRSATTSAVTYPAKRLIIPTLSIINLRRDGLTIKGTITLSDTTYSSGSNGATGAQANNIVSATQIYITHGITDIGPYTTTISGTNAFTDYDFTTGDTDTSVDINVHAHLRLTASDDTYDELTSNTYVVKAVGVSLSIRQARIGINETSATFLDDSSTNLTTLSIIQRPLSSTGSILSLTSSTINTTVGAGIQFVDTNTTTNGTLKFLNGSFSLSAPLSTLSLGTALSVGNGGTGLATITANSYLKGNGTSALVQRTYAEVLSDIGAAAASHTHGNLTNAGAIGSTATLPIITTTSGVLTTGSFGTTEGTFCQGNDSRLSDTRNTTNSITFTTTGGAGAGATFDGSAAKTIDYSTIGAAAAGALSNYLPLAGGTMTGDLALGANEITGGEYRAQAYQSDCNDIMTFWVLAGGGTISNHPTGAGYWYINTIYYASSSYKKQIAYAYNADTVYTRRCYNTTWTAWVAV